MKITGGEYKNQQFALTGSGKSWILTSDDYIKLDDHIAIVEDAGLHDNTIVLAGDITTLGDGEAALWSYGNKTSVEVDATSAILGQNGIFLLGDKASFDNAGMIEVENHAVVMHGSGATFRNSGTIIGGDLAVDLRSPSGVTRVVNEGTITGQKALIVDGPAVIVNRQSGIINADEVGLEVNTRAGETSRFLNYGLVAGHDDVVRMGDGNDTVVNRGTIQSDLALGDGDDVFDGRGAGNIRSVFGNMGDDTYIISQDTSITESMDSGTDTVKSSISWTLKNDFENLILFGKKNTNAEGNALANRLTGNAGDNTLAGHLGRDLLTGGAGADTFVFAAGDGRDRITDFDEMDFISLTGSLGINGFSDLKANHLTVDGDDLLIIAGTDILRLEDVSKSDLDSSQFIFPPN